jgi:hypothetical protein
MAERLLGGMSLLPVSKIIGARASLVNKTIRKIVQGMKLVTLPVVES